MMGAIRSRHPGPRALSRALGNSLDVMWGKGLSPRGVRKNAGAGQGKVKGRTPSRGKARRSDRAEIPGDREGKQALGEAVDSRAIAPHTPREPPAEGLISFAAY